ncbi:MAG: hypothetical protein ACFFEE_10390 [Candidatus Thorarchaeota archaeon]
MDPGTILLMSVFLITAASLILGYQIIQIYSAKQMMRKSKQSPWDLSEFLHLMPTRWKRNQYYSFTEESVQSLGYRFVGRFDKAILHWEECPVLDLVIEHKFPVKHLPNQAKSEDIFQAGLYALALMERGVSCSTTRLVNIYCLQDQARRCMEGNSPKQCWKCSDGRVHMSRFNPRSVIKSLRKMDTVWYNGRKPRPSPEERKCRECPYSNGICNYSAV